jgi:hypothetical protein
MIETKISLEATIVIFCFHLHLDVLGMQFACFFPTCKDVHKLEFPKKFICNLFLPCKWHLKHLPKCFFTRLYFNQKEKTWSSPFMVLQVVFQLKWDTFVDHSSFKFPMGFLQNGHLFGFLNIIFCWRCEFLLKLFFAPTSLLGLTLKSP